LSTAVHFHFLWIREGEQTSNQELHEYLMTEADLVQLKLEPFVSGCGGQPVWRWSRVALLREISFILPWSAFAVPLK
jgi:hypothetical protein